MKFVVTAPDGTAYDVDGPGTEAEAIAFVQSKYRDQRDRPPLPRGGPGMEEGIPQALQGAKSAFDRAALGVKGLLPQSVQDAGDWIDRQLGSGGLTKQTAVVQPASWSGMGGAVGADIAMGAAPTARLVQALRLPTVAGRALTGLGAEVLGNAGYAAATTPGDFEERAKAAAYGGTGALGGNVLVRALRGVAPGPKAKLLQDAGVTPTFGQVLSEKGHIGKAVAGLEDSLKNLPLVGNMLPRFKGKQQEAFQQATRNAALPIDAKTVDALSKAFSDRYSQVLGGIDQNLTSSIYDIDIPASVSVYARVNNLDNAMHRKALDTILETMQNFADDAGNVRPRDAHAIESRLKEIAFNYKSSTNPEQRDYAKVLSDFSQEFARTWREGLGEVAPQARAAIDILDERFAKFVPLRRAATTGAGTLATPEAYSPKVLLQAIRTGDKTLNKGRFLEGDLPQQQLARAAEDVLGSGSYAANGFRPFAIAATAAAPFVGHGPTAAAGLTLAGFYSLPGVQKVLTGQNVSQKAFEAWLGRLSPQQQQAALAQIANIGRAVAQQQ